MASWTNPRSSPTSWCCRAWCCRWYEASHHCRDLHAASSPRYQDTNGDGISDEKRSSTTGSQTKNNLEHQDTALQWGIDNHLYSGNLSRRFRITGKGMGMEPVQIFGRTSQWGLGHGR